VSSIDKVSKGWQEEYDASSKQVTPQILFPWSMNVTWCIFFSRTWCIVIL